MAPKAVASAAASLELTPESMDNILTKLEARMAKVDQAQGSRVKLPKAELEFLEQVQIAQEFMSSFVQDRAKLNEIFAIDVSNRLSRAQTILSAVRLSGQNADDKRLPRCVQVVVSIEKLLLENKPEEDLEGKLAEALEQEKVALAQRRSSVRLKDVSAAIHNRVAIEKKMRSKIKKKDPVPLILAVDDPQKLLSMEPNKKTNLGAWMIWMVHRAHLNDPSLKTLDFNNFQMPAPIAGAEKNSRTALVAPKLVKAIATNKYITNLLLANTNLQSAEGRELGASIASNKMIVRLVIDSNMLKPEDLEIIMRGVLKNRTLEGLWCNNQVLGDAGRSRNPTLEVLLEAVKTNTRLVKLGMHITEPHFLNVINKQILQNNDAARQAKRKTAEALEEEDAARAEKTAIDDASELAKELEEDGDGNNESENSEAEEWDGGAPVDMGDDSGAEDDNAEVSAAVAAAMASYKEGMASGDVASPAPLFPYTPPARATGEQHELDALTPVASAGQESTKELGHDANVPEQLKQSMGRSGTGEESNVTRVRSSFDGSTFSVSEEVSSSTSEKKQDGTIRKPRGATDNADKDLSVEKAVTSLGSANTTISDIADGDKRKQS